MPCRVVTTSEHSVWVLQRNMWFGAGLPPVLYGLFSRPVHVGFVVDEVGLRHNFF
jgi:hypothetical protein